MKRKEIFIVIALIVFGIAYHFYKSGEIDLITKNGFFISLNSTKLLDKNHQNNFIEKEINLHGIKKIKIINIAGEIIVERSKDNTTIIKPIICIYHKNKSTAKEIYNKIKIRSEKSKENIKIEVDSNEKFPYKRVRVKFKLLIPETVELNLFNRYGNINIKNAGKNININEKHGNIFASDINSNMDITHKYGKIKLKKISGNINVKSKHSKLNITNSLSIKIESEFTKVNLENIKDDIEISNSHSPINMKKIKGNITINSRHCKIKLDNIISEYLNIKNSYDDVYIKNISGNNLYLYISHADLNINFNEIKEQININSNYSDITIEYPKSTNPSLNICTKYGKIKNYTKTKFTIIKQTYNQLLSYQGENPEIIINDSYGDIYLKNND